jgi:hypothetical protein
MKGCLEMQLKAGTEMAVDREMTDGTTGSCLGSSSGSSSPRGPRTSDRALVPDLEYGFPNSLENPRTESTLAIQKDAIKAIASLWKAAAHPPMCSLIMASPHQIFIPALTVLHQPPASCQGTNLIMKTGHE